MPITARAIAPIMLAVACMGCSSAFAQSAGPAQSTSAPLQTDSAGSVGNAAASSVFRVLCHSKGNPRPGFDSFGTGFLHKSGLVLTAAHVTDICDEIGIAPPDGSPAIAADVAFRDDRVDLAALKPVRTITGNPIPIAPDSNLSVGEEIAIWGFPGGYVGRFPMVSVGYFAGGDAIPVKVGPTVEMVPQMVVNAAVNHGDSGAPVVMVETGQVIGVADNKIVPLSGDALAALAALQSQNSGFMYPAQLPDGTTKSFSEAQVVALVLEELRQQVQLVVGHAVWAGDLRKFLQANKIDP